MSSFRGAPDDPWSLSRAVDSMRDAARVAGRPGLVWIAGIVYPSMQLGLHLTYDDSSGGPGGGDALIWSWILAVVIGGSLVLALALPVYGRLMAGLARLSPPRVWEQLAGPRGAPSLLTVWQAGRGLTAQAIGMWVLLGLLQRGPALLVLAAGVRAGSLAGEAGGDSLAVLTWALIGGPIVALVALYSVVFSVLHQLALHSLAHNRRGVASALVHAWRIARHDPWATARSVAVDFVLLVSVLVLGWALVHTVGATCFGSVGLGTVLALGLAGFAGVTRAGFWARAYRALGGLSPDDGVPGLGSR